MMRLASSLALAVILWLLCWTAVVQGQQQESLPSADDVLDAFYEALGGEMALAGMSEIMVRGSYGGASSGTIEAKYKDGKFLFEYHTDGFGKTRHGFDGKTWWRSIQDQPAAELEGKERAMSRHFTLLPPQFLNWRNFEGTTEVVEATDFRGTAVWRLRFSSDDGIVLNRFFDRDSGLLVAVTLKAPKTNTTTLYEFEEHEGVLWPCNIKTESEINDFTASAKTEVQFTEFEVNAELDDAEFAMSEDNSDDDSDDDSDDEDQ